MTKLVYDRNLKNLNVKDQVVIGGTLDVDDTVTFNDDLSVSGNLNIEEIGIGSSGSPVDYSEGSPVVEFFMTNDGTSGSTSAEPLLVESTLTGAGQVGGRSHFKLNAENDLGDWANALKASTTFDSSGSVTGLGSCIATDLTLSDNTTSGSYTCFEGNIILPSSASLGTATSFIKLNFAGTDADTGDEGAFLFDFGGEVDAASGKFIDTDKDLTGPYAGLRVNIEGVGTKYIPLVDGA